MFSLQKMERETFLILDNKLQASAIGFLFAFSILQKLIKCRSAPASLATVPNFAMKQRIFANFCEHLRKRHVVQF